MVHAMNQSRPEAIKVLVTGVTGYVGGRLVPRLLDAGYQVRCLVRSKQKAESRTWAKDDRVEIVESELSDHRSVAEAMRGCSAAYYLVHSMMVGSAYRDLDKQLASDFAKAATMAGLPRIIYLGGLGETGGHLSEHLSSRREVEAALEKSTADLTVLRAAMIIGSGSASFEILRYLVERLPIMVTPRWVKTVSQPIGIGDVLRYLVDTIACEETRGRSIDIGGPGVYSYQELMKMMAKSMGLRRRLVIPVPLLTPKLSSLWIQFVTPINSKIARPLAEGLRNEVVCRDELARELMPGELNPIIKAIDLAVRTDGHSETTCFDAGPIPGDPDWAGGLVFKDQRSLVVKTSSEEVFRVASRIGGHHGYFGLDWLWKIRAALDLLFGGAGLRRGRRDPDRLGYGDVVDFWRVSKYKDRESFTLRAEMKMPGKAELEFSVKPLPGQPDQSELTQTARFRPFGLFGILYWYGVAPLHHFVFGGMIREIARQAENQKSSEVESNRSLL